MSRYDSIFRPDLFRGQTVLVTGGGGFLGWAVVRKLLEKGALVRSFSRRSYPLLAAAGVDQVQGDIGDPEAVAAACRGVGTVFHVAAKAGVWGIIRMYFSAIRLLHRGLGAPRVIFAYLFFLFSL